MSLTSKTSLEQELLEKPGRFIFFQAVRLLQLMAHGSSLSRNRQLHFEGVRFRTDVSLVFPSSDIVTIEDCRAHDHSHQFLMTIANLRVSQALPEWYTELIVERATKKDKTLWDFLDLFNHQLASLFYQGWRSRRFAILYEDAELNRQTQRSHGDEVERAYLFKRRSDDDRPRDYLQSVAGFAHPSSRFRATQTQALEPRFTLEEDLLCYFSGLFGARTRNIPSLEGMVSECFQVEARIQPFVGSWLALDSEDQTKLGGDRLLGVNAVLGSRCWDLQSRFRVVLGPLSYERFLDFTTGKPDRGRLIDLIRLYVGLEFDFEIELLVDTEDLPALSLAGDQDQAQRLGMDSWMALDAKKTPQVSSLSCVTS